MDIKNAVILITSAGSNLGCILANHFASLGAKVVATDTNVQKLYETTQSCNEINSTHIHSYPIDSYSETAIQGLFNEIERDLNRSVDVLINYWPSKPFPALTSSNSAQDFSQKLSALATPIFSFGQASAEKMRDSDKKNVIINMITYPQKGDSIGQENASSMVLGLTKSWAKELDPFNIRVGGIIPGSTLASDECKMEHWALVQDELIRSTEYIVSNEYFNGRVVAAEV